ncbi:hypothetical protein ROA7450_04101 [Roseovarius albus]|uniref:YjiS-like domain-containing protein n=1 Tax=Roseovarius albus TaxID=1247867 RepID=A0A1X7A8E8_9RHOB|nr:DUF1127 domain-containing protein [Roseovarius albus]SLN73131.1 hypothetical protein ROA7450_04101 [Roseovarius albus]
MTLIDHGRNNTTHHTSRWRSPNLIHSWIENRRRAKEHRAIAHLSDRMLRDIGADNHIRVNPDKSPYGSWLLALSRFQP